MAVPELRGEDDEVPVPIERERQEGIGLSPVQCDLVKLGLEESGEEITQRLYSRKP